jgi:hypothetical protein
VIPQRLWWVLSLPVVGGDHPLHCVHESGADVGRVSHDCRLAGRCLERDSWGSGQCCDYVLCVVATAFTCVLFPGCCELHLRRSVHQSNLVRGLRPSWQAHLCPVGVWLIRLVSRIKGIHVCLLECFQWNGAWQACASEFGRQESRCHPSGC